MALSLGVAFAVLAAAALALQSIAVSASSRTVPLVDLIAAVFAVNVLVLVPATALVHGTDLRLTTTASAAFAVAGLLGSLFARAALFVGIDRLGPSRAESLKSTFPLVAAVAAVAGLGEQVSASLLFGTVLLVVGAAVVSWDTRATTGRIADLWFPLTAALLLGIDPVFTKVGFAEGTPALVGVTVRVLAAAAGFGLFLAWRHSRTGERPTLRPTRWVGLATLANTVYLGAYLAALSRAPVSLVAPIIGASPLVVLAGSAVVDDADERLTGRLVVGVVVLVVGVAFALRG